MEIAPLPIIGLGAAALAYAMRYSFQGDLSDATKLKNGPLQGTPLKMGRFYYRMPDGSIRSRKREYRRVLMESKGVTSGRQWRKLRKSIPKSLRAFV